MQRDLQRRIVTGPSPPRLLQTLTRKIVVFVPLQHTHNHLEHLLNNVPRTVQAGQS